MAHIPSPAVDITGYIIMQIFSNPGAKQLDARCHLPRCNVHWRLEVFKSHRTGFHADCDFTIHPCKAVCSYCFSRKRNFCPYGFSPRLCPAVLLQLLTVFVIREIWTFCRRGATEEKTSTSAERVLRASAVSLYKRVNACLSCQKKTNSHCVRQRIVRWWRRSQTHMKRFKGT